MPLPLRTVAVLGGGPAGLMAAVAAAEQGARVTLLERQEAPGRKLLATGGGRCNLANTASPTAFMAAFGRSGRHMQTALAAFGLPELRAFFARAGVPLSSPDGVHLYPQSGSARTVLDALRSRARSAGVEVRTGRQASRVVPQAGRGLRVECADGDALTADAVVIATGGLAMPKLGAHASGLELARALGHTLKPPVPALVPLVTSEADGHALAGVSLPEVTLRATVPALRREVWRGALLFTHRGLSGPAILDASGAIAEALAQAGPPVELAVNLHPAHTEADWRGIAGEWRDRHGARKLPSLLAGCLPSSLVELLARRAGVDALPCARWTRDQQASVVRNLQALAFTVTATEGMETAMVTRGGILLKEVSPDTLESRIVPGVYLAGEILDLDGPCGGYNLLWAFSGGHLAGTRAAGA